MPRELKEGHDDLCFVRKEGNFKSNQRHNLRSKRVSALTD